MKNLKKTKGHKNNVRTNKKERRKIKIFKEKYINILSGLYITFWGTLYITLNDIITKKTTFCQGYMQSLPKMEEFRLFFCILIK